MSTPIRSVDELCRAVEETLDEHLVTMMTLLGYDDTAYKKIKDWQQLPTLTALSAATLPAGAISTAGLVRPPKQSRDTAEATWRIVVGFYERGRDHDDTQARVRNWCAGIRTTLLARKSLGGLASSLIWSGEEHDILPGREQARTIAAAAVAFDVTATVLTAPPAGALPVVTSTHLAQTVRPTEE